MVFRGLAVRDSMDLQCGQRVEKSPTVPRLMNLRPHEQHQGQQGRRVLGRAWSVAMGHLAD